MIQARITYTKINTHYVQLWNVKLYCECVQSAVETLVGGTPHSCSRQPGVKKIHFTISLSTIHLVMLYCFIRKFKLIISVLLNVL